MTENYKNSLVWVLIGLIILLIILYRVNLNFEQAEKIEITVITKSKYGKNWEALFQGVYAGANEFGVDVKILAPDSDKDVQTQKILIQTAALNSTGAILIAPIDYRELNDIMLDISKQSIPVITMVSVDQRYPEHNYIGLDHYEAGKLLGESAIRQVGEDGVIAIMGLTELTQDNATIEKGIRDYLKAYPNIKIVDVKENTLAEFSVMMNTQELLKEQEQVQLFIGIDEASLSGICTALKDIEKAPSVIGLGSSHEIMQYLENGLIDELLVPNEFAIGYMAIKNTVDFINHKAYEEQLFIDPIIADADNMYEQNIEKIIFPIE